MVACLCFRFADIDADGTGIYDIENGGNIVDVDADGECAGIYEDTNIAAAPKFVKEVEVKNQSCLYKIWMCACWANQAPGCLCAFENADKTVTMVKPKMGVCPMGAGKLLNPKAKDAGGLALQCAPNPCLACCACGKGVCTGDGDPADNDDYGADNCCDCCGAGGGYPCGMGGSCIGSGGAGYGNGGNGASGGCGCGGGGNGGSGGCGCSGGGGGSSGRCGSGTCINQNVGC